MIVKWDFAWNILPVLLKAAITTLEATALGYAMALSLGLVLAIVRRSRVRAISWTAGGIIEFVRSTPFLIQLYFLYFILPNYGLTLPAFVTGILGLGIHYSAYTSEVYRAGIEGIPQGQWEAARSLNFTKLQIYRRIIIPQAIPPIVPALGNYLVGMIKDTPILSAIAVVEIMQRAKIIGSETFRYLEPITMVGIFFLLVSLVFSAFIRKVERGVSMDRRIEKAMEIKG